MSKEIFFDIHERLVEEYLEAHPNATEDDALEATAEAAFQGLADYYGDLADHAKDMLKERRHV